MTTSIAQRRFITTDAAFAARALDAGAIVAHGFANIYAITARADEHTVRRINLMTGRPPDQVGNLTAPPAAVRHVWDFGELPPGLNRRRVLKLIDTFFALGPFGFRGPAAAHLPAHLTTPDGPVNTTQLIAPGYACPANDFLAASLRATGEEFLSITSANRSRHATGADDSPAHWRTDGLRAEFGDEPGVLIVEHPDEAAALSRYPRFQPMSPTVLGFHRVEQVPGDHRPHLILERHGSLAVDDVRSLLDDLGYGLVLGPRAQTGRRPRDYARGLCDR